MTYSIPMQNNFIKCYVLVPSNNSCSELDVKVHDLFVNTLIWAVSYFRCDVSGDYVVEFINEQGHCLNLAFPEVNKVYVEKEVFECYFGAKETGYAIS